MKEEDKKAVADAIQKITKAAKELAENWQENKAVNIFALSTIETQTRNISRRLLK
jgi:hypothetical protein